jgi:hypothetical protein
VARARHARRDAGGAAVTRVALPAPPQ